MMGYPNDQPLLIPMRFLKIFLIYVAISTKKFGNKSLRNRLLSRISKKACLEPMGVHCNVGGITKH